MSSVCYENFIASARGTRQARGSHTSQAWIQSPNPGVRSARQVRGPHASHGWM